MTKLTEKAIEEKMSTAICEHHSPIFLSNERTISVSVCKVNTYIKSLSACLLLDFDFENSSDLANFAIELTARLQAKLDVVVNSAKNGCEHG